MPQLCRPPVPFVALERGHLHRTGESYPLAVRIGDKAQAYWYLVAGDLDFISVACLSGVRLMIHRMHASPPEQPYWASPWSEC